MNQRSTSSRGVPGACVQAGSLLAPCRPPSLAVSSLSYSFPPEPSLLFVPPGRRSTRSWPPLEGRRSTRSWPPRLAPFQLAPTDRPEIENAQIDPTPRSVFSSELKLLPRTARKGSVSRETARLPEAQPGQRTRFEEKDLRDRAGAAAPCGSSSPARRRETARLSEPTARAAYQIQGEG